ncbi:MAG: aldehyde dehydrogenase family protein, partial [Longimicrobiales bacterium]
MTTVSLDNFIAGDFASSASAPDILSVNPSDEADIVARVPAGAAEDVARATAAAAAALPGWRRTPG